MYEAILFDLYGTLLDIHTDEDSEILWEKMRLFYASKGATYTAESLKEGYHALVAEKTEKLSAKGYIHPECDVKKVFKKLYSNQNIDVKMEEVKETARLFRWLSLDYVKPYDHAIELLNFLKEQNKKIILVSNAQSVFTVPELKATGLYEYFDAIYISSDHKISKPNPKYLEKVIKEQKLTKETCLFVGNDHRTDVQIANEIGIDAAYLHTNCSPAIPDALQTVLTLYDGKLSGLIDFLKSAFAVDIIL